MGRFDELKDKATRLAGQAKDKAIEAKEKATAEGGIVDKAKAKAEDLKEKVTHDSDGDGTPDVVDRARSGARTVAEKAKQAAGTVAEKAKALSDKPGEDKPTDAEPAGTPEAPSGDGTTA